MIATLGSSLPHIRSGKLKALALGAAKRSHSAPELPTLAELGVPGYDVATWYGLLVPRGTPQGIIGTLNTQIASALGEQEFRERLAALGFEPTTSTPRQFADYIKSEIAKWARAMKDAGVAPISLGAAN